MDDSVLAAPVRYTNIRPRQHQAPARFVSQCSDEPASLHLLCSSIAHLLLSSILLLSLPVKYIIVSAYQRLLCYYPSLLLLMFVIRYKCNCLPVAINATACQLLLPLVLINRYCYCLSIVIATYLSIEFTAIA